MRRFINIPVYLFVFLPLFIFGGKVKAQITVENSYADIKKKIHTFDRDDIRAFPYINVLIQKAKNEKNYTQLYRAYRKAASYAPENIELQYADSCVWAAEHDKENLALMGNAYLSKGVILNGKRKYEKALFYYIKAERFLHQTDDLHAQYRLLFAIGQLKNYLELYTDAIPMVDSANRYFSKFETRSDSSFYLYSLNAIKDMYIDLGKYERATQLYHKGKMINTSYKDKNIAALLDLYEGYNLYKQKHYTDAIRLIENSIPYLEKKEDFSRTSMADFYLGLCYFDMGNTTQGIAYFMKMDSVFEQKQYTRPRFRKAYEKMINYYEEKKQSQKQLWAINRLLAVDEQLNTYYKGITRSLRKEYDTALLYREKEKIENESQTLKQRLYIVTGILLTLSIVVFLVTRRKKIFNQKNTIKNKQLPQKKEKTNIAPETRQQLKSRTAKIPDKVVQDILEKLQLFEDKKEFLKNGMKQGVLAKKLKTNTTYLSNVINEKKGCSFSQYLNRLRINYLLTLFKEEPKYRKYNINSLADVTGYGNAKSFKLAFEEVTQESILTFLGIEPEEGNM